MSAEKSSKKGIIILAIGMLIGIGVGVAVCSAMMSPHHTASALAAAPAKRVGNENAVVNSQPPSLFPLPSQTGTGQIQPQQNSQSQLDSTYQSNSGYQNNSSYQANSYQNEQQQWNLAPQPQPLQTSDGSLMMPGVNTVETSAPGPITAGSVNPSWTIGRNGLIQNPCVDPPSAHGRQTGQY